MDTFYDADSDTTQAWTRRYARERSQEQIAEDVAEDIADTYGIVLRFPHTDTHAPGAGLTLR